MKKIAILGAGISGLSLAWFLQHRHHILLFEQKPHVGGWIHTRREGSGLFECGPRSLRTAGSGIEILKLVEELGIQDAVIESSTSAKTRYIAKGGKKGGKNGGKLCPIPFSLQLAPTLLKGIVKDLCMPKGSFQDESVSHFFIRRFGKSFHDTFIEPLTAGIYAAGPELLSMQSTFGSLLETRSCILKLLFSSKKPESVSDWVQSKKNKMISFHDGIQFLPNTLKNKLKADIYCNTPVRSIMEGSSKVTLVTDQSSFEVDHVISTLPAASLMPLVDCNLQSVLEPFSSTSVVTVSLGWKAIAPILPGFGFLCSSKEERELLGIVFDSNVFVEHNGQFTVRLSVMMGGTRAPEMLILDEAVLKEKACQFVRKYLGITVFADFCIVQKAQNAIGLYTIGQKARYERLTDIVKGRRISILGASFTGVSVGDCIQSARAFTKKPYYT